MDVGSTLHVISNEQCAKTGILRCSHLPGRTCRLLFDHTHGCVKWRPLKDNVLINAVYRDICEDSRTRRTS